MARLLRSTTQQSVLRKPVVVAPSVVFPPIARTLAPSSAEDRRLQFKVQYDLRPPTVVGSSITFSPVETRLAKWRPPLPRRSKLGAPLLATPTAPFSPVVIRLARAQPRRSTIYVLSGPVVVSPSGVIAALLAPIRVRLAGVQPRLPVRFKLRPPTVVGSSVVFSPVRVKLAQTPVQARRTSSRLRGPVTFAVVVQALLAPIRVVLARQTRPPGVHSKLRPPVTLTAVVQALLAPITIRLARVKRTSQTTTRLRPPAVVAPSIQFRPILTRLARTPIRPFKSRLRAPTVITTVFTIITGYFQNKPFGQTRSGPDELEFQDRPAGQSDSSPDEQGFD